ncbi:MAG: pilus assembly protein TadG-related protein [Hyphomicrobiaceae bacterium]
MELLGLAGMREDRSGAISILAGLMAIPLFGMVGLAIDYTQANRAQKSLQIATDAAALAAAQAVSTGMGDPDLAARTYFDNNYSAADAAPSPVLEVHVEEADRSVVVVAAADAITKFARIFGKDKFHIDARSEAQFGANKTEVALVLDNTASMSGAKMDGLKDASRELVEILFDAAKKDGDVKFALVPFGEYVNVGLANRNAPWMSVEPDSSTTAYQCWDTYPNATSSNCRDETYTCYSDGVPNLCTGNVCDWDYGSPVEQCGDVTTTKTWNGCAGSRDYPLDVSTASDFSTRVPGVMNVSCPSEISRLTTSESDILAKIDGMVTTGDTFVQPGLIWGWRTLDWRAPFSDGSNPADDRSLRKYIVLMTDGANTKSPNYPDHSGGDMTLANTLTAETCAAIKAEQVTIYTIAFEVADPGVETLLKDCATSLIHYHEAADASALAEAFRKIGREMSVVHLSK